MVDIEPYQYQKTTNVKEHNDIVAKINEIVDVINNSGADTLGPRVSKLETDVSTLDSAVKIQYQDIASIKDKDQAQDNNIGTLDAQVKGITESLVSDINVIDGTTTGKFKVRLDREKAPSINSNDYDLQKATSIELVQGSGPSMLKAQITLSDGTILRSDDFLFTTEAIGTDVYISSFVFKNGNVDGTISADIGLSNGSTLEANNFAVPMDPSLLNTVQDLSTRLTAVEGGSIAGFKELEAQVNTNKTNIATLTTEIDDLDIKKADQSNSNQEIVAGTITATNITKGGVNVATVNDIPDISGKVNIAQGIENAGKMLVVGNDGNVSLADNSTTIPNVTPNIITSGFPCNIVVSYVEDDYASKTLNVTTLTKSIKSLPVIINNSKLGIMDSITAKNTKHPTYYAKTYSSGSIYDQIVAIFENYYIIHFTNAKFNIPTTNSNMVIELRDSNNNGYILIHGQVTNEMKLNIQYIDVNSGGYNLTITELVWSNYNDTLDGTYLITDSQYLDIKYLSYTS